MILKLIFKWSWFNFVSKIQKLWIWRSWKVSAELPWQTIFLFSQSHHRINKKNYFYMRKQCQKDTVVGTSDIQEISLCSWCSKPIWQKYLWISNFFGSYEKKNTSVKNEGNILQCILNKGSEEQSMPSSVNILRKI